MRILLWRMVMILALRNKLKHCFYFVSRFFVENNHYNLHLLKYFLSVINTSQHHNVGTSGFTSPGGGCMMK